LIGYSLQNFAQISSVFDTHGYTRRDSLLVGIERDSQDFTLIVELDVCHRQFEAGVID
jgi:hypothetical protein